MWTRGLVIGSTAALGMLAFVPGAGTAMARSAREAMAVGLAVNQAVQRQMLRATAEAVEVVEDLIAEVRAEGAPAEPDAPAPEVVLGRVTGLPAVQGAADLALVHQAGRRLRLRLRGAVSPAEMHQVADTIRGFPGVEGVEIRPVTRSLVITCEGSAAAFARALETAGVATLAPVAFRHPAALITAFLLARADAGIRARSRGKADLKTTVGLLLKAVEAARARRGL